MMAPVKDAAAGGGGRGFLTQEERGPSGSAIPLEISRPSRQPRILVLEDEETVQSVVQAMLKIRGFDCDTAGTVAEARARLSTVSYDIVLVDVHLPDGSGLELIGQVGAESPMVIVMTGSSNIQTAVQAIRGGAIDFITKPFSVGQFLQRVDSALQEWRSRETLQGHARALEALVRQKTEELSRTSRQIDEVCDMTVAALGAALNLKDHETADHCARVSENSVTLGRLLSLPGPELKNLKWGAYLHDVGKIGIPEQLLLKKGALLPEERRIMQKHPLMGHAMIRNIEFLGRATDIVLAHHESYDGTGYPKGLRGESIPLAARIFSVVDTLDAMTSDRPYRAALPFSSVAEELQAKAGTMFDAQVVKTFLRAPQSAWHVQRRASAEG